MSLGDIIILAVLLIWLALSLRYMRKRRKSGKCIGRGAAAMPVKREKGDSL